jgi:hypothetical protein
MSWSRNAQPEDFHAVIRLLRAEISRGADRESGRPLNEVACVAFVGGNPSRFKKILVSD